MELLRRSNAAAFSQWPVTVILCVTYVALFTGLLHTHHVVPSPPKDSGSSNHVNLTQAWYDLQHLSSGYHPYNSHNNDDVRAWLIQSIKAILDDNKASYKHLHQRTQDAVVHSQSHASIQKGDVVLYDDAASNVTFAPIRQGNLSVYFEGTNIIVYIKGSKSSASQDAESHHSPQPTPRCVLVNAHYDSVSTGFGATDDGVGVVTILQLIKYYTTPGNQPARCLVALLNNGEEDYLNGARAFAKHPLSDSVDAFVNLEGAGAGGRAAMFRSTDADITKAYRKSPYPFGTAASADGFRQGLVRSQTDYVIFNEDLGYRGIDVAFLEPRAKYHTSSDSARETSVDSVWHMLSAALATTQSLVGDSRDSWQPYKGSEAVYFDLFGRALGLINLGELIDASAALIVVGPVLVIVAGFLLSSRGKFYIFATQLRFNPLHPGTPYGESTVELQGRRGFFRAPVTFVLTTAVVVIMALLISKVNPFIIYSSPYSIWSMLLSAWLVIAWFGLRAADRTRPTALQRLYTTAWIYVFTWILLIFSVAMEFRQRICGAYIGLFLNATALASMLITLLELLRLPPKHRYFHEASTEQASSAVNTPTSPLARNDDPDAPSETSPLLTGTTARRRRLGSQSTSLPRRVYRLATSPDPAHASEQPWAQHLPTSLWTLSFLVLAPLNLILVGQLGLFLTSALPQTLADGSAARPVYLALAALSTLLCLPTAPFIHRLSSRVSLFLLAVCIGTTIYNLTSFPFSSQNRFKVYFQQHLDLTTANTTNRVSLTGAEPYIHDVVTAIPSAAGQDVHCNPPDLSKRSGLTTCVYSTTLLPNIAHGSSHTPTPHPSTWLQLNTTRTSPHTAHFTLHGAHTRACKLLFRRPILDFNITGAATHNGPFSKLPPDGLTELRLWKRTWATDWSVAVRWSGTETPTLHGTATCLWSDANDAATIPALTEVYRQMPVWSTVTKAGDGLVEGSVDFAV